MDIFYRTHDYLVRNYNPSLRRALMDEIDWSDRLIGIKGPRGVGKTTFLLDYAREKYGSLNRECLYINLNQFYFTTCTLVEFAGNFVKAGGKVLLLDQVFKYPEWSSELRRCIDLYPDLQIVFTGSSVMRLREENKDLNGIVSSYNLTGFSMREFINLKQGLNLPSYNLEEIIKNHEEIARNIQKEVNPMDYIQDYLHHGYYPFFLEQRNYSENLLKTINMTLEVDVLVIKQIEQRCLYKLRKLLYLLGLRAPAAPNVSQLASEIDTSRATVMNYLKYLADARLITLLNKPNEDSSKKPAVVYLDNTNLSYAMNPDHVSRGDVLKTFFLNHVKHANKVTVGDRSQINFLIQDKYNFKIDEVVGSRYRSDRYYAVHNLTVGDRNVIPLWLFGFLY